VAATAHGGQIVASDAVLATLGYCSATERAV
jgi:hypothetical protein